MSVEQIGEGIARAMDRRGFVKKAGIALFGAVTTFAVRAPFARATGPCPNPSDQCTCRPPNGWFCTQFNLSFCSGSSCESNVCWYNFNYYPDACWCSKCCSGTYYHCCDCWCPWSGGPVQCGCKSTRTC